ncbi:amino acid/amide ABC transporter ATP-binding protein 2, HAAT family [Desulfonatronum thiosulfatophilum]|uniref:Amino acid/amide ABC transporter ATP-binding protein 2, HAAT family n=1 Tax=Desulfonatronum thiosulfatophilum TaxID=617002 RepID=A0A1G6A7Z9_9BACT|nr:ABC transporter ATP-binding protein [Desulfonatronum thiosulfatophilum]SDB04577.1 amino acid/amide ABC transporter ATP-binding protein 2, HAAT family [Desulfonatronum thiosulfatophilum]
MLRIRNLHAGYSGISVLHGVSLHVAQGETVCLVGANGAGKSTLLQAVSGLIRPISGELRFEGQDLSRMASHRIVAAGLVQVPEARELFPSMTVRENLDLGAFALRNRLAAADIRNNRARLLELFPVLGQRLEQKAGTLSGGEQQMLAIARALMARPRLLVLDEPSLGLAPLVIKEIFRTLQELQAEGLTILLVEQNALAAMRISTRAYVLQAGRLLLSGTAEELQANDEFRRAYLGRDYKAKWER